MSKLTELMATKTPLQHVRDARSRMTDTDQRKLEVFEKWLERTGKIAPGIQILFDKYCTGDK